MQKNEMIILNDVIRGIYTTENYRQMRLNFLNMITTLIPNGMCSFFLASGDSKKPLCDPVGVGASMEFLMEYMEGEEYVSSDYTRWHFMSGKTTVYRETDLYPDAIRKQTEYFQFVFEKRNFYYSAQIGISYGGIFLGVISFFREKETGDFTDKEMFLLDLIKDHLEYRCNLEWKKTRGQGRQEKAFDANRYIQEYELTIRECEVLKILLSGMTGPAICEKLTISNSTLKKHTLSIYKKLGIHSRWELTHFM